MPEGTYVKSCVDAAQLDAFEDVTETQILIWLEREALVGDEDDPRHALKALTHQALDGPLSRINQYLGENPDVSGGTIGDPIIHQPFVAMLRAQLCKALSRQGRLFFCPPLSKKYASKVLIAKYLYEFTWR